MGEDVRTIIWTGHGIRILDQTALPDRVAWLDVRDIDTLVAAIRRLSVRGAPALGTAGGFGVALALRQGAEQGWDRRRILDEVARVRDARPTAVNLAWGVDRVSALLPQGFEAVLDEALAIAREDEAANRALSKRGTDWLLARQPPPVRVLTHCNAGALATTAWGTGLGMVRELSHRGALGLVHVDETRPLLQGARLTAWELSQLAIPYVVQVDSAAPSAILRGLVDVAIVGADRVTANGDVANKIGTLGVALACAEAGIPFVVAAPESTIDRATATGAEIPIELRSAKEVLGESAPASSSAYNPAFDVTPAKFITALVTERAVYEVAAGQLPDISEDG